MAARAWLPWTRIRGLARTEARLRGGKEAGHAAGAAAEEDEDRRGQCGCGGGGIPMQTWRCGILLLGTLLSCGVEGGSSAGVCGVVMMESESAKRGVGLGLSRLVESEAGKGKGGRGAGRREEKEWRMQPASVRCEVAWMAVRLLHSISNSTTKVHSIPCSLPPRIALRVQLAVPVLCVRRDGIAPYS